MGWGEPHTLSGANRPYGSGPQQPHWRDAWPTDDLTGEDMAKIGEAHVDVKIHPQIGGPLAVRTLGAVAQALAWLLLIGVMLLMLVASAWLIRYVWVNMPGVS